MGNLFSTAIDRVKLCYNGSDELRELIQQIKSTSIDVSKIDLKDVNELFKQCLEYIHCHAFMDLISESILVYLKVVFDKSTSLFNSVVTSIESIDVSQMTKSNSKKLIDKINSTKSQINSSIEFLKEQINTYNLRESIENNTMKNIDSTINHLNSLIVKLNEKIIEVVNDQELYRSMKLFELVLTGFESSNQRYYSTSNDYIESESQSTSTQTQSSKSSTQSIDVDPLIQMLSDYLTVESYKLVMSFPPLQRVFYLETMDLNLIKKLIESPIHSNILKQRIINLTSYLNNVVYSSMSKSKFVDDIKLLKIESVSTPDEFRKTGQEILKNVFNSCWWFLDSLLAFTGDNLEFKESNQYPFNFPCYDDYELGNGWCVNAIIANLQGTTFYDIKRLKYPFGEKLFEFNSFSSRSELNESKQSESKSSMSQIVTGSNLKPIDSNLSRSIPSREHLTSDIHSILVLKALISTNVDVKKTIDQSTKSFIKDESISPTLSFKLDANTIEKVPHGFVTSLNKLMSFSDILVQPDLMTTLYNDIVVGALTYNIIFPYHNMNDLNISINTNDIENGCERNQLINNVFKMVE